jgi:GNAT superfamily N-acetyltransferase
VSTPGVATDDVVIRELIGFEEVAAIYPLYSQSGSLSEEMFRERLQLMLDQGNYRCIAAFIDGRMVGVSGFWTGYQLWTGKYVEADHVGVDREMRSRGIGGKLMIWIETEAVRTGCDLTRIAMILGRDRTRNFYRRLGYADDGLILVKTLSKWADEEFPEYAAHKRAMAEMPKR